MNSDIIVNGNHFEAYKLLSGRRAFGFKSLVPNDQFENTGGASSQRIESLWLADSEPMALQMRFLIENIVEAAKRFPHIQAVCHEVDQGVLSFVLCAPGIDLDEELDLTRQVLDVFDRFDETDADFYVSSRSDGFFRKTGMSVVPVP